MTEKSKDIFLQEIKQRISKEMPRILKEVSIYEQKLRHNELEPNPKVSPQFNG